MTDTADAQAREIVEARCRSAGLTAIQPMIDIDRLVLEIATALRSRLPAPAFHN